MTESITTGSTTYHFVYDGFGNKDSIAVGSRELASYEYNSRNGKLNTIHYGNGFSVRYVYDKLDNVSEVWYIVFITVIRTCPIAVRVPTGLIRM